MAINFGELDRFGKVPANELKDKIRGIAYDAIREILCDCKDDEKEQFKDQVTGVTYMAEMICDQIDEEVDQKNAEMQQILNACNGGHKDEQAT